MASIGSEGFKEKLTQTSAWMLRFAMGLSWNLYKPTKAPGVPAKTRWRIRAWKINAGDSFSATTKLRVRSQNRLL
jgi:hypothetical protein